jgi:predicted  nucleic acid-binding Zn-ribbon protein
MLAEVAMKETDALVRLQEIDLAVMRDKRLLANMPQTKKLNAVMAAQKKLSGELSKLVGLRKDAEMDLEDNEANHQKYLNMTAEVQEKYTSSTVGYRELADLESQLTYFAKRIEKLEFQHKDLLARAEKVRGAETNARALDKRLREEGRALVDSLKEQATAIEQEIENLTKEREEVVTHLSEKNLAWYAEASKRFQGLAVETLRGSQPSVCRVTVPASSFGDIRRGPDIVECPYCHRILVTDGMFDL